MSKADWKGLRRYQRKVEKGLIWEKPCNVGAPVWVVEDGRIVPSTVELISIVQHRDMISPFCEIAGDGFRAEFEEIGEKVFLSLEEAEKAVRR